MRFYFLLYSFPITSKVDLGVFFSFSFATWGLFKEGEIKEGCYGRRTRRVVEEVVIHG